jgi:Alkaline phosphatase PhoX
MPRKHATFGAVSVFCTAVLISALAAAGADGDFGLTVARLLNVSSAALFGIQKPLQDSALGPFTGPDNTQALEVAKSLLVSVISNITDPDADMIALWPNDEHPTHLFVCVENSFDGDSNPDVISVQRVDLSGNPDSNAQTIVKGLSSCDPIHRTPWGTLIVGKEAGETGGFYEILDPLTIANPIIVLSRSAGTTSDSQHMVKRQAVGSLSFEGIVILEDGTTYFGDENRPSSGKAGGGVYKFVPDEHYDSNAGIITDPAQSPFASGTIYGMHLGTRSNNTDYGQGSETGKGIWVEIDPAQFADADGNIILRKAQLALGLTGYYRPEDMDRDPLAAAQGFKRVCWTNTGNMTNGAGSAVETAGNYGELLCLEDEADDSATTGAVPFVTRFVNGNPQLAMPDNVAFQPHTGRLVVLEDGPVEVLDADGSLRELRGNDIWMCLPDGDDDDVLSDGCIRIASLRDTDSEPTGFIFDASGERAFVNLQHRATGKGALLMIAGLHVKM